MRVKRIKQITTALKGSVAVFDDNGEEITVQVALWALVEMENGTTETRGITIDMDDAETVPNFVEFAQV